MSGLRIDDFKQALRDGGSRPNLFEVTGSFAVPDSDTGGGNNSAETNDGNNLREMTFLIKAASIPSATIGTIEVPYRGRFLKMAGDRIFEPWTITVINSSDFALRNAFEKWSEKINGVATNKSACLLDEYFRNWSVKQLDRCGDVSQTYTLEGCFPEAIGPIELSHEAGNQIEEFTVTIQYQHWTHQGITAP